MIARLFVIALMAFLPLIAAQKSTPKADPLFAKENGQVPLRKCLNIGNPTVGYGPFLAEEPFIEWVRTPSRVLERKHRDLVGTEYDRVFNTQRIERNIVFYVHTDPAYRYRVEFGFAELLAHRCEKGQRVMNATAMGQTIADIDVFDVAGCNTVHWEHLNSVRPFPNGNIRIKLSGHTGHAELAALCFERVGPRDTPGPTPSPSPTSSVTPSPSPISLVVASTCQQPGCINLRGPGDYSVIGNSLSMHESNADCSLKSVADAELAIPSGARVIKALLYWSASGNVPATATAELNGKTVTASQTYSHTQTTSDGNLKFYGAEADVTGEVLGSGTFAVGGIYAATDGLECSKNAAYAAWSMVVVYEMVGLPEVQINICTDNFQYTYPEGSYTEKMECIAKTDKTTTAKTTVVAFESDSTAGEYFYINGVSKGMDLFKGATAPNLDIHSFDVGSLVKSGVKQLLFTFVPYSEDGASGKVDGLFFPITVARYNV